MRPNPANRLARFGRHGAALLLCGSALALGVRSIDAIRSTDEPAPQVAAVPAAAMGVVPPAPARDAGPPAAPRDVAVNQEPTPTAQPSPTSEPPRGPASSYRVAPGDTLAAIAARFGIRLATILENNPGLDPDAPLQVGLELVIPAADGILHRMAAGETVWQMAAYFGVTVEAVVSFRPNGLSNPAQVQVGQLLLFPGGRRPAAAVAAPPAPSPQPAEPPAPPAGAAAGPAQPPDAGPQPTQPPPPTPPPPAPSPSPTATATPSPSPTPSPTATPAPAATSTPTATPAPAPAPQPVPPPPAPESTAEREARMMAIIRAAFSRLGLDTEFAIRVARCESGLNPNAVGAAGELGLFQLHPRGVGYGYPREVLLDPAENSRIAAEYVAKHGWGAWSCAR